MPPTEDARLQKFTLSAAFIATLVPFSLEAQGLEAAMAAGSVINQTKEAIEEVVDLAFDRLDMTLLAAAMEARATVNSASLQFQDALTTSIDEVDSQQRRILEDLNTLNVAAEESLETLAEELKSGTNQALSDIRLLLSDNVGAVYVSARPTLLNADFFEIVVEGTALSNAEMDDFRVATIPVEPMVTSQDDGVIIYRVPMAVLSELPEFNIESNVPVELQVAFSFVEAGRWFWSSDNVRPFTTTAIFLPEEIGSVRAVFSVTTSEMERRRQTRGPFTSNRVQSRVKWDGIEAGHRRDIWLASPSEGWRIDLSTAEFRFEHVNDSCSNSRATAAWTEKTEQILRVTATTSSDRRAGATCRTKTTISFDEWRSTDVEGDFVTDEVNITASDTARVALVNDANVRRARLSHIEVSSPMFGEGTRIFRIDNLPDGISADYDAAAQAVFVTVGYR